MTAPPRHSSTPTSPMVRTTLASPSARSYCAPTTPRAPERIRSAMSVERSLIRSQVRSTCSRSISSMVGVRPPRDAARTLGVTRSTMSRRKPPGTSPVRTASSAALTAPHESWPSTTMSGQSSTPTPNSSEPSTLGSRTCPAVRTTNRSPRPWSKMISAATRESAQPKKIANGFCFAAIRCRNCTSWCGWARSSAMNRALPSASTRQASSGVRGRVPGCVRCRSFTLATLPAAPVPAVGVPTASDSWVLRWSPGQPPEHPTRESEQAGALLDGEGHGLGDGGEEVVALVVDHDEGREVLDLDLPDRLHAQLGVLEHLDAPDAVLGQPRSRATDRAEVEPAVGLAPVGDLLAAVALGEHHHRAPGGLELVDVGVHPAGGRRAERAGRHPLGGLGRTRVVDRVVAQVVGHRLAGVEPLLDLRVGDVAGDHQWAVEREPGLDRVLRELLEDLRHRAVEIDRDDRALPGGRGAHGIRLLVAEPGVGLVGQEARGVGLELLDEDALGGDLAEHLPVGGARHRDR